MKEVINNLVQDIESLRNMSGSFDRIALDHGSPDQTRAMMIESMFNNAIGDLAKAIGQLEILNRELY